MAVIVYSKHYCYPCKATTRRLAQRGVAHTVVNLDDPANSEIRDELVTEGFRQTPIVEVRDEYGDVADRWSGYNPSSIDRLALEPVPA